MKSYIECCEEVGYDRRYNPPEKKFIYYAYKNGTCSTFSTKEQACGFSSLVERKVTNQDEIDAYSKERSEKSQEAFDLWYAGLKEEYSDVSDQLFNAIYSQAYEDGHSSGYDNVACHFSDLYYFALEVLKIGR